jgi:hypothetical protein
VEYLNGQQKSNTSIKNNPACTYLSKKGILKKSLLGRSLAGRVSRITVIIKKIIAG